MSDCRESCPKIRELLIALETISWSQLKLLAPHLTSYDLFPLLTDIERDYQGKERHLHAFQAWLERDLDASWENVVSALRAIYKNVLALEIEKKYCTSTSGMKPKPRPSGRRLPVLPVSAPALVPAAPSVVELVSPPPPSQLREERTACSTAPPSLSPASTSTPSLIPPASDLSATGSQGDAVASSNRSCDDRHQEISEEAAHVQEQFVSVVISTKVCFMAKATKSEDFLTKFKVTLTTLSLLKKNQHLLFLKKEKDQIMEAKNVDKIFDVLDPYWNYVDYAFLDCIIKKLGTRELKEEMEKYIAELETFEKKTSVYDFDLAVTDERNIPAYLKMITFRLARDPKKCSLYEVRQFKNAVINRSTLNDYAPFLESVSCSSVKITLAVPQEVYRIVIDALDKPFMSKHNIESMQFIRQSTAEQHTSRSIVRSPERRLRLQGSTSGETSEEFEDMHGRWRFRERPEMYSRLFSSEPSLSYLLQGRLQSLESVNLRRMHSLRHEVHQLQGSSARATTTGTQEQLMALSSFLTIIQEYYEWLGSSPQSRQGIAQWSVYRGRRRRQGAQEPPTDQTQTTTAHPTQETTLDTVSLPTVPHHSQHDPEPHQDDSSLVTPPTKMAPPSLSTTMSDRRPIKLPDLLVELQDSISWSELKLLAHHLTSYDLLPLLTDIERDYQGKERYLHAFKGWLERDCDASWENVVSALRVISKNVLALEIEKKYCTPVGSIPQPLGGAPDVSEPFAEMKEIHLLDSGGQPCFMEIEKYCTPVGSIPQPLGGAPDVSEPFAEMKEIHLLDSGGQPPFHECFVADALLAQVKRGAVAVQKYRLEDGFLDGVADTKVCLLEQEAKSESFLPEFKVALTTLPDSERFQHLLFLKQEKDRIMQAADIDEIFDILDPHWNYTDYSLLEHLINKFGTSELKQKMKKYIAALEKETSVRDSDVD